MPVANEGGTCYTAAKIKIDPSHELINYTHTEIYIPVVLKIPIDRPTVDWTIAFNRLIKEKWIQYWNPKDYIEIINDEFLIGGAL